MTELLLSAGHEVSPPPVAETMSIELGLRIEYRDTRRRWWKTTVPVGLELSRSGDGTFTCGGAMVLGQRERAALLREPFIRQDTLQPLAEIDRDLDVGTVEFW
jgi:hypothetical protein